MSAEATFWAKRQPCASSTEKCILLVLADYAGPDGSCYPGQPTVASQACCSIKSVERALASFEERGWITRTLRRRPDGYRTSDLIRFSLADNPEPVTAATSPDTMSDENTAASPDTVSGEICTQLPDTMSGESGSHPTWCPTSPDTMSGLNLLVEPLEDTVAATRAKTTITAQLGDWPAEDPAALAAELVQRSRSVRLDPRRAQGLNRSQQRIAQWREEGASWNETVLPVVMAYARTSGPPIKSWRFFDRAIAESTECWRDALEIRS